MNLGCSCIFGNTVQNRNKGWAITNRPMRRPNLKIKIFVRREIKKEVVKKKGSSQVYTNQKGDTTTTRKRKLHGTIDNITVS